MTDQLIKAPEGAAPEDAAPEDAAPEVKAPEVAFGSVAADPYPWPFDGSFSPRTTAIINIDWQHDFCGPGGYVDAMGYDLGLTRAGLGPTAAVLAVARRLGFHIIHTREGHHPDLSDLPANKLWRSRRIDAGIGDPGPCGRILTRGEPGWQIVPEVAPLPGEAIIDKPGKGSFFATDLDAVLRAKGITHIILTGITTDVCVHTTMRDANDRGYECLLLSDCTGATDYGNYLAALKMITMQGGVFGAVADSAALLAVLDEPRIPSADPVEAAPPAVLRSEPFDLAFDSATTALVIIDMQRDFVLPGGFGEALGNDTSPLLAAVEPTRRVLAAAREHGIFVIHTREGHRPDLADAPPAKLHRGGTTFIGEAGPMGRILVRGEEGHGIVDELAPIDGEPIIDKPGKGSFYATDLDLILTRRGIKTLIVCGVTLEVCVHTTVREANDRGYEVAVLSDCVASYFPQFQQVGLEMITAQGGIFGWVSDSQSFIDAIS